MSENEGKYIYYSCGCDRDCGMSVAIAADEAMLFDTNGSIIVSGCETPLPENAKVSTSGYGYTLYVFP
jgi:hypothetical protein